MIWNNPIKKKHKRSEASFRDRLSLRTPIALFGQKRYCLNVFEWLRAAGPFSLVANSILHPWMISLLELLDKQTVKVIQSPYGGLEASWGAKIRYRESFHDAKQLWKLRRREEWKILRWDFRPIYCLIEWCSFTNVYQIAILKSTIPPKLSARLEPCFIDRNLPCKLQLPTGPLNALSWLADQFTKDFLMFYALRISKTRKSQFPPVKMVRLDRNLSIKLKRSHNKRKRVQKK